MIADLRRRLGRFRRRSDGVSAIEFAFVAPVLLLFIVGTMELGMILFADSLLEGGLREAARFGTTGAPPDPVPSPGGKPTREEHIVKIINRSGAGVIKVTTANITTLVYPDFSSIGKPEPYVDRDGNGRYDAGEPYTDVNCSGSWESDMGRAGLGIGGEVVLYRANYDRPLLTGFLASMIGEAGKIRLEASVAVRNEPFGGTMTGC